MNRTCICVWFLALWSAPAVVGQIVPPALASASGTATVPFFATTSRTYQVQYDAGQMGAIPVGTAIRGISLRLRDLSVNFPSFPDSAGITWSNFEVSLARANMPLPGMTTNFATNQFQPQIVRSGPLHIPGGSFVTGGNPSPFGVEIPFVPFTYQGSDFVVTIRMTGASTTTANVVLDAVPSGLLGAGLEAASSVAATGTPTGAAIVRFTVWHEYQRNQPAASMTHIFLETNGATPAIAPACVNGPLSVVTSSTLAGYPHDIAIALVPQVSRSHGASTPLLDGQVFNVPLAEPSLTFLWSGSPVPAFPPFAPLSLTFNAPPVELVWCSQMLVFDPSRPALLALSQATTVGVSLGSFASITGPTQDDQFFQYRFGINPLCAFSTVPFYGRNYDTMWVIANGRIMFILPNNDFSSTPAEASFDNPSVGFWTDLVPAPGTISVVGSPNTVSVNWNGVRYFGEASPSVSFSISIEADGHVAMTGLSGIAPNPLLGVTRLAGDAQLLGITNGFLGTPIVSAPFPLGVPVASGPLGSLADFWPGTAATAPNGIRLVRTLQDHQPGSGTLGRIDFEPIGTGYFALSQ